MLILRRAGHFGLHPAKRLVGSVANRTIVGGIDVLSLFSLPVLVYCIIARVTFFGNHRQLFQILDDVSQKENEEFCEPCGPVMGRAH